MNLVRFDSTLKFLTHGYPEISCEDYICTTTEIEPMQSIVKAKKRRSSVILENQTGMQQISQFGLVKSSTATVMWTFSGNDMIGYAKKPEILSQM